MKEIEAKYFIDIPCNELNQKMKQAESKMIFQQYLFIKNEHEIKVRRELQNNKNDFYLIHKIGEGVSRLEYLIEISRNQFNEMFSDSNYGFIYKTRNLIPYKNLIIEVDVFKEGFYIAEIEFCDFEQYNDFNPPLFLKCRNDNVYDVSSDERFKNKNIAQHDYSKSDLMDFLKIK